MKSFRAFGKEIFQSQEEKDRLALEQIERNRQQREDAQIVIDRLAALEDGKDATVNQWRELCRKIDEACKPPTPADYALSILNGVELKNIGADMAARAAFKTHAESLKKELRELTVGKAEKNLADYKRLNQDVIAGLPKLAKIDEPPFVPAPRDDGEVERRPSNGLIRSILGVRAGEKIFPGYESPNGNGTVRNLDDD
jgi:hypothetical protein